jgi:hypothetical protein
VSDHVDTFLGPHCLGIKDAKAAPAAAAAAALAAPRTALEEFWFGTLARRDVRTGLSAAVALAVVALALDLKAGKKGDEQGWEAAATATALVALVTALGTMAWMLPVAFDAKYGDGPDRGQLRSSPVSAGECR